MGARARVEYVLHDIAPGSETSGNESLFRDVNKRVNDINKAHDLWVTLSDWACECPTTSRSPPRAPPPSPTRPQPSSSPRPARRRADPNLRGVQAGRDAGDVERVVHDIDAVVMGVRFAGWQASREGDRTVKFEIRKPLKKYGLEPIGEIFDRAYAYVAEHY
jgi:hypothetical protein